jgi:hypothetical protein
MAAKIVKKDKPEKAPRFVLKSPRELAELVGMDSKILVSSLSLRTILGKRASARIEKVLSE